MKAKIINSLLFLCIVFLFFISFNTSDSKETIDAFSGATPDNEVMDAISGASDDEDDHDEDDD